MSDFAQRKAVMPLQKEGTDTTTIDSYGNGSTTVLFTTVSTSSTPTSGGYFWMVTTCVYGQ
ncbi:MAG: hypothetical protein ABSF83_00505 [Nitrososphaerales archaeon]